MPGLVKWLHISCAALTITGFVVRGYWMYRDSPRLRQRWVRIAPHGVDTLLLLSALWLMVATQQYPFVHGWLTAKVVALGFYIGLGMIALRLGRSRNQRAAAFVLALLVFCYIVAVALTRQVLPGLQA
jgi:uncharacterized membrane protein SirB2